MGWVDTRKIDGDYFSLIKKNNSSSYTIQHHLDQIELNNYWVYKSTNKLKRVDNVNGEYAGYTFFDKKLYDTEEIDKWIKFFKNKFKINYLARPFPRLEIQNKIEMI